MYREMRTLAVIPARGGSKGIPRKNLATVGGISLIAHAAALVADLDWLDQAVLSTDDSDMAAEASSCGLAVIDRPADLATDYASNVDVWKHAWLESEKRWETRYELGVLLQPTSPLREPRDVTACVKVLMDENRHAAITVSPAPGHFTPEKIVLVEDGHLTPYLGDRFESTRQRIRNYYYLNGYCYAARRNRIVAEERVHGENVGYVVIDRPVVNIDDPFELELANWLLERGNDSN